MPETIEEFCRRAAAAGVRELWVSIGSDGDKVILHFSPRDDERRALDRAISSGISTKSFVATGNELEPCVTL